MIKYKPTKTRIERCIELHIKSKYAWFWRPPATAADRRSMERLRSDHFKFKHKGVRYEVLQTTRCTCRHVYYHLKIYVDGVKKDVRALKKVVDWNNQRDLEKIQRKLLYSVNKPLSSKRKRWHPRHLRRVKWDPTRQNSGLVP